MPKKDEARQVVVNEPEMKKNIIQIRIVGDSPLITHKWSEKAKKMMLKKQQKEASEGKEIRNPMQEAISGLYILDDDGNLLKDIPADLAALTTESSAEEVETAFNSHSYGFPVVAFKCAMLDAAFQQELIAKKTTARGAILFLGEYAKIDGVPEVREDMVRLGGISRAADLRYRPEFKTWSTVLTIQYLENSVTADQIYNWLSYAGFSCGVGEWRIQKDGNFGAFHPAFI